MNPKWKYFLKNYITIFVTLMVVEIISYLIFDNGIDFGFYVFLSLILSGVFTYINREQLKNK